jgi:hypothetical protein
MLHPAKMSYALKSWTDHKYVPRRLNFCFLYQSYASTPIHNYFNFLINDFNITFIRGLGASGPGTIRQRKMNSNFIQIDGGRLYDTAKMGQQEYGAELVLNGSKPSVTNPKQTFLASLAKSASNLSSAFHASPSEGCPMTPSFSRMPSLCNLMCLTVLLEINNYFK